MLSFTAITWFFQIYDSLTADHPRHILTGDRHRRFLVSIDLPVPSVMPRLLSLIDFQRSVCSQFCDKYSLADVTPRPIRWQQVFQASGEECHSDL